MFAACIPSLLERNCATAAARIIRRTRTMRRLWSALSRLWLFSGIIMLLAYASSTRADEWHMAIIQQATNAPPIPEQDYHVRTTPDAQTFHARSHAPGVQVRMSKAMWERLWTLKHER